MDPEYLRQIPPSATQGGTGGARRRPDQSAQPDQFAQPTDGNGGNGARNGAGQPPRNNANERPGAFRGAADEDAYNPPWDRASMRLPVPPASPGEGANGTPAAPYDGYDLDSMMERSFPGISLGEFTGTGKIAAVPLRPGASGKGIRAPRTPAGSVGALAGAAASAQALPNDGIEVDAQPSVQLRALRSGNLIRAATIVTAALLISRILGLGRTSLFAATFGNGFQADAFTNAFTLPDTIFSIVSGGALASAFIPVFTSYLARNDRKTAWHVASAALNLALALLVVFCVVSIIFAPQLLPLLMPPFFFNCGARCEGPMIVELTRVMLLQPIFLGGATIAVAILQARQSFVLPAIGQVIYTGSLIGGILATDLDNRYHFYGHIFGSGATLGIYGPTFGVVVGAALQFAVQIPGLMRAKMTYRPTLDIVHPGVREIGRLMAPRLLNAAILYISVFVNRDLLGTLHQSGALYGYVTAFTLVMLPNGIFGMAVSQAAFPTLAILVATQEWERLRRTILRAVQGIIYLAVPSAIGLIVLADPISRVLLAHGQFDLTKLPLTTQPLIYFAIGLTGLSLVEILTRCFYALQDTRTPTQVSILQFMFAIGMSILLLPWGSSGLALASSLAWLGEALVLLLLLRPRLAGFDLKALGVYILNVVAASVAMGLVALLIYYVLLIVLPMGATSKTESAKEILRLTVAIIGAAGVYFGVSHFLGTDDVLPLDRLVKRVLRRR
ncbi:MAG: murein biosynthesis integral membrane protein MurJ [Ktedonobacterales bacterium]